MIDPWQLVNITLGMFGVLWLQRRGVKVTYRTVLSLMALWAAGLTVSWLIVTQVLDRAWS